MTSKQNSSVMPGKIGVRVKRYADPNSLLPGFVGQELAVHGDYDTIAGWIFFLVDMH